MKFKITKKNFCIFVASGTWQGMGYFRTICCLSGWKGIGYVLQLFPFCASLGEPNRLLPAWGAGTETGRSGTRYPGTRGRQNQKFMWCWGGPGCRCRALIKPGCGAVGFHSEAREDGLCGMLTGNSCCSCLSRRLFINITVKIQTSRMFSDIYSNPTAKRGGAGANGGGLKPFSNFFFYCNLTRPFLWFVASFDFVIECLQTFLISTLIKEIESKPIGEVSLVLVVCRLELAL